VLTDPQRQVVERELLAVSMTNPRAILIAALPQRIGELVGTSNLPAGLLVAHVVNVCMNDGYTDTPPVLARLLTTLVVGNQEIDAIVKQIVVPPPRAPNPFKALVLDNKLPFLDRPKIRDYLEALTGAKPLQPVVVIVGDKCSGKSYTAEFIDYLRRTVVGIRHARIDVPVGQGKSFGPAETARDIMTAVGGNPEMIPDVQTNLERWTKDACNTIVFAASKDSAGWWFVLDGFNKIELREDTQFFIVAFAKALSTGVAQMHRLILIDFDRTILPLSPGTIAVDTTGSIPRSSVAPAVLSIVQASGKQNLNANDFVQRMEAGLPDPILDLPDVGQRFRALTETLDQ
jgi:hypothetical protein